MFADGLEIGSERKIGIIFSLSFEKIWDCQEEGCRKQF